MQKHFLLPLFIVLIFLSGCTVLPDNSQSDLSGTGWTLINFEGRSLLENTAMTAFFEDGNVSGSASCNHYFGSYTIQGKQIQIEGLGWTEMACMNPEGIMDQEFQIMNLLSQANSYSVQGDMLQVNTENGGLLIFQVFEDLD